MRVIGAIFYFFPVFVAFSRRNDEGAYSPWRVLLVDLFLGWTIIGWLYSWDLALRGFVSPRSTLFDRPPDGDQSYSPQGPARPIWGAAEPAAPRVCQCTTCNGQRQEDCIVCKGRGTWYEQPRTANGIAVLAGCDYCQRSGKIRCRTCNGQGHVPC